MKTKIVSIEIPDTDDEPGSGIRFNWTDGWALESSFDQGEFVLSANKEGLLSLANHLINLAQDKFPAGHHVHFDRGVDLTEDSVPIVFIKS